VSVDLYSDRGSVARSLSEAVPNYKAATLTVVETDAIIIAETREEIEERNLVITDDVCTIDWDYDDTTVWWSVKTIIQFHEDQITKRFTYEPSGTGYGGLSALSDSLAHVEGQLTMGSEEIDYGPEPALALPRPDFAEINADKIFKYEVVAKMKDYRVK